MMNAQFLFSMKPQGQTWTNEGKEVFISYEEAAKSLISELEKLSVDAAITYVSESGSTYGTASFGKVSKTFRISGHDVRSMDPNNHNGPKMADFDLRPDSIKGFTPKQIIEEAAMIFEDLEFSTK